MERDCGTDSPFPYHYLYNIMIKRLISCIILFSLISWTCGCSGDNAIEETTLSLFTYIISDDSVVSYTELLPGKVYGKPEFFMYEQVLSGMPPGTAINPNSMTVESNGTVHIVSDEVGIIFVTGEAKESNVQLPTYNKTVDEEYLSYRGGTFVFSFQPLDTDDPWYDKKVPDKPAVGTKRHLTISAYDGYDTELKGAPKCVMRVEIVFTNQRFDRNNPLYLHEYISRYGHFVDYTVEVLSVERTPPAYW